MREDLPRSVRSCLWLFLVMVLIAGAAVTAGAEEPAPGFFYESLSLSTPRDAVQQFVHAFGQGDFATTYLVLANDARSAVAGSVVRLMLDQLVTSRAAEAWPGFSDETEHGYASYMFLYADIMDAARETGGFVIDLSGPAEVIESMTNDGDGARVRVTARLPNESEPVEFTLEQAPSGRWRLLTAAAGGAEPRVWPGSVE